MWIRQTGDRKMGQIRRRIFAVVELYDSFTRRPVADESCHVVTETKKNIIAKENGSFIFLDEPGMDGLEVTFCSDIYHSRSLKLSGGTGQGNDGQRMLWMTPNEKYIYPLQTAIVEGVLPEEKKKSRFYLVPEREEIPIYLGRDYQAGEEEIAVHGYGEEQLVGTEAVFYAGDKPVSEVFELAQPTGQEGVYRLAKPLKKGFAKGEAILHRAYAVKGREDHSFFLALPLMGGKSIKCDLLKNGKMIETWEIEAGKNDRKE
jgi:hypothetical protein